MQRHNFPIDKRSAGNRFNLGKALAERYTMDWREHAGHSEAYVGRKIYGFVLKILLAYFEPNLYIPKTNTMPQKTLGGQT
jgi:hypothetical protein